jgi:hypothetical protein
MPGGASDSGSIGVVEGHDILAAAGLEPPFGVISVTERSDVGAIAGTFATAASISLTERVDLPDLASTDTAFATIAVTVGNDSPSVSSLDTAFGSITLTGGTDSLAAGGAFTVSASTTLAEGRDIPTAAGIFEASGSIANTSSSDSPALAGFSGDLGSIDITESADTPAAGGSFMAAVSVGVNGSHVELHDSSAIVGTFATSASIAIGEGFDSASGVSSTLEYHVYANTGVGDPINYGSAIATTGLLDWTSGTLTFPGTWRFGVRAFDPVTGYEEENLDCSITLILDAAGRDITNRPLPSTGIRAFATAGGGIRVEWGYNTINPSPIPTGFHVYIGTGGSPNYASVAVTVLFAASVAGTFVANLAGLSNSTTYTVGVRAYNATAEEPNTNTVNVTASSVGPTAVVSLTATAIV